MSLRFLIVLWIHFLLKLLGLSYCHLTIHGHNWWRKWLFRWTNFRWNRMVPRMRLYGAICLITHMVCSCWVLHLKFFSHLLILIVHVLLIPFRLIYNYSFGITYRIWTKRFIVMLAKLLLSLHLFLDLCFRIFDSIFITIITLHGSSKGLRRLTWIHISSS